MKNKTIDGKAGKRTVYNVIAVLADADGIAFTVPLFYDGKEELVADITKAKTFRKMGSAVMEDRNKKVVRLFPRHVIEMVAVEIKEDGMYDPIVATTPAQPQPPVDTETDVDQGEEDDEADQLEDEGEEDEKRMSSQLEKYRKNYLDSVSSSGKKSKISGDEVSLALVNLTPEEVMEAAEKILGLPDGELKARYDHLNPGQKRMNAGNGVRAAIKRGDITIDDMKKHLPGLH